MMCSTELMILIKAPIKKAMEVFGNMSGDKFQLHNVTFTIVPNFLYNGKFEANLPRKCSAVQNVGLEAQTRVTLHPACGV